MKKQLLVVGIIVLLVCVGLSGCNDIKDNSNSADTGVDIVNYTVVTHWEIYGDGAFLGEYYQDGFYHGYPESATIVEYIINGTIKNNAGEMIESAYLYMDFYDANGNLVYEPDFPITFNNLPNSYTDTFSITLWDEEVPYFANISSVQFTISLTIIIKV